MGPAETPTPPRVNTRGSCSAVEPTQYSSQYELLVDGDPPRIVAVRRVLEGGQTIHGVPILPHHFTHPQKQSIHDTVIHEDDDMAEAEDDPLSKLMTRLPRYMDTIVVDQGWSSMYRFVEPHTIQPSGNTLENRQHYLQTWMDESKRDVYLVSYIDGVIGKSRSQLVQILYPKVCNQRLDSWECSFYVMCWIKTIIPAVITDDWNECFKSTSPILEDIIRQIR
ncbi:hypothetical protein LR48_Vigan08g069700 [Vigna angularis]|uniref:Uncharacterized protein n=1 Tax=Phaseolus angularis TaxID=3914 RepID=A0A0L9V484_PHAAN|nr:hypothetical protein LR48_Vigan08g069700 [Vigna angularis]